MLLHWSKADSECTKTPPRPSVTVSPDLNDNWIIQLSVLKLTVWYETEVLHGDLLPLKGEKRVGQYQLQIHHAPILPQLHKRILSI